MKHNWNIKKLANRTTNKFWQLSGSKPNFSPNKPKIFRRSPSNCRKNWPRKLIFWIICRKRKKCYCKWETAWTIQSTLKYNCSKIKLKIARRNSALRELNFSRRRRSCKLLRRRWRKIGTVLRRLLINSRKRNSNPRRSSTNTRGLKLKSESTGNKKLSSSKNLTFKSPTSTKKLTSLKIKVFSWTRKSKKLLRKTIYSRENCQKMRAKMLIWSQLVLKSKCSDKNKSTWLPKCKKRTKKIAKWNFRWNNSKTRGNPCFRLWRSQ